MAKLRKRERKQEAKEPRRIRPDFKQVVPRTTNQKEVVRAIRSKVVSVIIGTAGTGKTLLAVSEALSAVEDGRARSLVLIRPLVPVGESLGYLPGSVNEKVAPYSTPLLYYIDDLMNCKGYSLKLIEAGVIEIVPIALIRGRTFDNSVIIFDEAQNTTPEQFHAVLTRLGQDSKLIVVGDEDQVDLKGKQVSGLTDFLDRITDSPSVGIVEMDKEDIQRNEFLKEVYGWYANN